VRFYETKVLIGSRVFSIEKKKSFSEMNIRNRILLTVGKFIVNPESHVREDPFPYLEKRETRTAKQTNKRIAI